MGNRNLLKETIEVLARHSLGPADVRWVGSFDGDCSGTWAAFAALADFTYFTYDAGFGGHEIPMGLVVVGSDWWLERHEYDGSEWWEFKRLPKEAALPCALPATLRECDIDDPHPLKRWP